MHARIIQYVERYTLKACTIGATADVLERARVEILRLIPTLPTRDSGIMLPIGSNQAAIKRVLFMRVPTCPMWSTVLDPVEIIVSDAHHACTPEEFNKILIGYRDNGWTVHRPCNKRAELLGSQEVYEEPARR